MVSKCTRNWAYRGLIRHRNADGFDRLHHDEAADDNEGEFDGPIAGGRVDPSDSDTDQGEWETGICRSNSAKDSKTEDLTLSDIILDPDGNFVYYWLGAVSTAVIYNIAVIVLRIAFSEMRDPVTHDSVFYVLDTIGDLVFMLDVIVHLRVSYYEDGCLMLEPDKIVEKYTKSKKFIFDLLAILPLGSLYYIMSGVCSILCLGQYFAIAGDVHILLVRTPRLLKYSTMARFFDLTDSRTRSPYLLRAFKLTLNLWVVIHWIGCFYYMLSEYEGLGSNEWVYPNGTEYKPFSKKYIRIMYWSLMTLTTIGERPAPDTDLEYVFTGLTFLIGVFVFAAVVGNVGDVISNMNAAKQDFQSRMDQIKFYMLHRAVDEKLQNRVKRWADYTWTRTQAIDEPTLFQMLPDRLRTEIAINVHLETLKKVKIFEECEEGLLRELVLKLRPQVYSPGDYICRKGEVGREMYIVNHGKVEILIPNAQTGRRTVIATLSPGNYFGEISLLKLGDGQNRRTADVKSVGYSELLRLSRKDLMSALVEYPRAKSILEKQALARMQETEVARQHNGSGEITSYDTSPEENQPIKKSDALLKVIRSPNFQKLMAARHTETTELRHVLEELKSFDSQATRQKLEIIMKEKEVLSKQLQEKKDEVEKLKTELTNLTNNFKRMSGDTGQVSFTDIKVRPASLKFAGANTCNSEVCSKCVVEGLTRGLTAKDAVKAARARLQRYRSPSSRGSLDSRRLPITSPEVDIKCRCRFNRPSNNSARTKKSSSVRSKTQFSKTTNCVIESKTANNEGALNHEPTKIPKIYVSNHPDEELSEHSDTVRGVQALTIEEKKQVRDLNMLEDLLTMDPSAFLSDASQNTSDDSSDDNYDGDGDFT